MCCKPTLSGSFSQQQSDGSGCAAKAMAPQQRQQLALQVLAGTQTVTAVAEQQQVSRKFVYCQLNTAQQALDLAFVPDETNQDKVLFYIPVTKAWLRQLILGLAFICHSSIRGIVELLRDLLDCRVSVGHVVNVLDEAVPTADAYNASQELSAVRHGLHDEIFQVTQPVLVGVDAFTTYCYLLSLEEHRDADTWGVRLLELQDRGFHPDSITADFGKGLRAGQELAMPGVPCRGDVFHALQNVTPVVSFLENRAYQALDTRHDLERKQAQHQWRHGRCDRNLARQIPEALAAETQAITLATDVALLARWLREDVFALAGPAYADRCALYDFILAELRARQPLCPHRLGPICTFLKNQRDTLLAFARQLDKDLSAVAEEFQVPEALVRQLLQVQTMDQRQPQRWAADATLRQGLRGRYYALSEAVVELHRHTVRASSAVENLNSRLRGYFFLRRHLGPKYLTLLQFFLNHRRFLRSEHPERVNKSPAELLTGRAHPHWLEMLGFTLFSRN
jgi:hypothetical protein